MTLELLTPARLQAEQVPWVLRNFGPRKPHQPLLGMMEELGELRDAVTTWNVPEIRDALADTVVFAADYCTTRGWNFEEAFLRRAVIPSRDLQETLAEADRELARVAHHQLKSEQGIRGTPEEHALKGLMGLRGLLVILESMALHFGWTLMEITGPVWAKVKQRDFTKNARTGDASAHPRTYYAASGLENAPAVATFHTRMRAAGWQPTYDWTLHGNVRGQGPEKMAEVAAAEIDGVARADVVIVLLPGGRGTHVELGAALALKKPLIIYSSDSATFADGDQTIAFYHHTLVHRTVDTETLPSAAGALLEAHR